MKTDIPKLTDIQLDTLAELYNMGIGAAAAALSEMVQEEIRLTSPKLEFVSQQGAKKLIDEETDACLSAVVQEFSGDLSGSAFLVFPRRDSLELVRRIMHSQLSLEQFSELEEDALNEVGNIILNTCFSTISDVLNLEFSSSLPKHIQGESSDLFHQQGDHVVLMLYMNFSIPNHKISGSLNFMMSSRSLTKFVAGIDNYICQYI